MHVLVNGACEYKNDTFCMRGLTHILKKCHFCAQGCHLKAWLQESYL